MRTRTFITSAARAATLLGGSAAPAMAAPAAANGPGVFITNGDRVHISSTPPRTASAHAWWTHVSGPGTKAKVAVWLQMKSGDKWHSVAKNAKNLKSGNDGSARRVVARPKSRNFPVGCTRPAHRFSSSSLPRAVGLVERRKSLQPAAFRAAGPAIPRRGQPSPGPQAGKR